MLTVTLKCDTNPDFGSDQSLPLPIEVEVVDLAQAKRVCYEYIAEWRLGGGNWTGGQVKEDDQQIAQISYNGRVWDMADEEIVINVR